MRADVPTNHSVGSSQSPNRSVVVAMMAMTLKTSLIPFRACGSSSIRFPVREMTWLSSLYTTEMIAATAALAMSFCSMGNAFSKLERDMFDIYMSAPRKMFSLAAWCKRTELNVRNI